MNDRTPPPPTDRGRSLMDEMLRAGVPEIKLALGEVIDRENARPLPPKYARLMPQTLLRVTLRGDAAEALQPIAGDLERELTDSCNRHGSLYDRRYRVQLQRSDDPDASLYTVSSHAGDAVGTPAAAGGAARGVGSAVVSPDPVASAPVAGAAHAAAVESEIPLADPDATRLGEPTPTGWDYGRWVLVVEGDEGQEREAFRISDPLFTVGRSSDDPGLRASIAISDAPHVSRRQLAFVWEERDGAPGFRLYNLGLNVIHLPGTEIPGARTGKGELALDRIAPEHIGWLPPGVPLRIGEQGPILRIQEVPAAEEDAWIDPDATVFD